MQPTITFPKVWYRSRPIQPGERTLKAMVDRGSLAVSPGRLAFRGKRTEVEITDIRAVTAQFHGRDSINRWVTVTYGEGKTAMFVDGGFFGWRGIAGGGNQRLQEAIEQAAAHGPADAPG